LTMGEKIKFLRKENKLSQEMLAELVGVSRQAISKWETGLSNPDTNNLIRLSETFHILVDELVDTANPVQLAEKQVGRPFISKIVVLSYLISFTAIIGYFCPPVSNVPEPYLLWICMGFIGGVMLVLKNRNLCKKSNNQKVLLMDLGMLTVGVFAGRLLPDMMGLVKMLIMAIPMAVYFYWISKKYFLAKSTAL